MREVVLLVQEEDSLLVQGGDLLLVQEEGLLLVQEEDLLAQEEDTMSLEHTYRVRRHDIGSEPQKIKILTFPALKDMFWHHH